MTNQQNQTPLPQQHQLHQQQPLPRQQLSFNFCDAPTGHGKTTAIITEVNKGSGEDCRFLIVSPYLLELDRICAATSCQQPTGKKKQQDLQQLLARGENVCCTHALFNQLTKETIELLRYGDYHYHLIIDEEPNTIQRIVEYRRRRSTDNPSFIECYGQQDYALLMDSQLLLVDPATKRIMWNDDHPYNTKQYDAAGIFEDLRRRLEIADLYAQGKTILQCPKRSLWTAFASVTVCSYRMKESLLRAYCDLYGITVNYQHVEDNRFADGYRPLKPAGLERLHCYTPPALDCSCSKYWYDCNIDKTTKELSKDLLRLLTSFRYYREKLLPAGIDKKAYYWTCFTKHQPAIAAALGRWLAKKRHVPCNMKATNALANCCVVGYFVKRYMNVDVSNFLAFHNVRIDKDAFALSEFIQFVWRANIRKSDNSSGDTYVFIGSKKLYDLFTAWLKEPAS